MAFREVCVFEVREVLRLWLGGKGLRTIEPLMGLNRKTVRRYVECAVELGLVQDGGEGQLDDEFLALVIEGCSNREIADRLHLSVRTVEKHVESLLRKTNTSSRTKLARVAADT